MGRFLATLALKYVTAAGAVVVACAVARCLLRAARHAAAGDNETAAGEALAAAVAPIDLACAAVAGLVKDAAEAARELGASRQGEPPARARPRPTQPGAADDPRRRRRPSR